MSCYIVDDETIDTILNLFSACRNGCYIGGTSTYGIDWQIRRVLGEYVPEIPSNDDWTNLGQSLMGMNLAAYYARYGDWEGWARRDVYQYHFDTYPTLIRAYKAIKCLLYQCFEGDIPERWSLYKAMDAIKGAIAEAIVESMNEYKEAHWG